MTIILKSKSVVYSIQTELSLPVSAAVGDKISSDDRGRDCNFGLRNHETDNTKCLFKLHTLGAFLYKRRQCQKRKVMDSLVQTLPLAT